MRADVVILRTTLSFCNSDRSNYLNRSDVMAAPMVSVETLAGMIADPVRIPEGKGGPKGAGGRTVAAARGRMTCPTRSSPFSYLLGNNPQTRRSC